MKKIIILGLLLISGFVQATTYTLTYVASGKSYTNGVTDLDGVGGADNVVPGDTIKFGGDMDGYQTFTDYVGTKALPITIDLDGYTLDLASNTSWNGFDFVTCDHIVVRNGTILDVWESKFGIRGYTGAFVFEYLTINGSNQCISIHNDPFSGPDYTAHRSDYPPDGISNDYIIIRYCTLYDSKYETIYLGCSNAGIWLQMSTDRSIIYQQPLIDSVRIYNNTVYNAGNDGIQADANRYWIYDNYVHDVGLNLGTHNSGIQCNSGGYAYVFNNKIVNSGVGVFVSASNSEVYNNVIDTANDGLAVNITHSMNANSSHNWYNNTMVTIDRWGAVNYNGVARNNHLVNNIIHLTAVEDGTTHGFYKVGTDRGVNMKEGNNLEVYGAGALTALDFVNIGTLDYELGVSSTALTGGTGEADKILPELINNIEGTARNFAKIGAY
jgi:hypothetical protein